MSRRKKPRLSAEDAELWARVTQSAKPMTPVRSKDSPLPPKPAPKKAPLPAFEIMNFRIGDTADTSVGSYRPTPASSLPVRMDSGKHRKMIRGKIKPEARIDLHGMTMAQAHPALTHFISRAHDDAKRLVLVITGKGRDRDAPGPIPMRRGVLKHQVPGWLTAPPLNAMVLEIREAHLSHGGTGAYYVYLRRQR